MDCEADMQQKSVDEDLKVEKSKDANVISSSDVDTKKNDSETGFDLSNVTKDVIIDEPTSTKDSHNNGNRHEDKTIVGEKDVEIYKPSVSQSSVTQENKDRMEMYKEQRKCISI